MTTATYVDNGQHTGGVLTVTDGMHTANINLMGNYSAAKFATSSDGHGGTTVVDPSVGGAPSPHSFIAAMASVGAGAAASLHSVGEVRPAVPPLLAAGRGAFA